MINTYSKINGRYSALTISPELISRLKNLDSHSGRLNRQANTFSGIYHHPGYISRRWYLGTSALPFPHVIATKDNGTKINLYLLVSKFRLIIHLKMNRGLWWHEDNIDEADAGAILPNSTSYKGFQLRHPATENQIYALKGSLTLPAEQLPKLTAYNADLLIKENILLEHMGEINRLIKDASRRHLIKMKKQSAAQALPV